MALADLSFKFYTDAALTAPFSNLYQLVHETNLSDNPQDKMLYFGSTVTAGTRSLKAVSNPGVDQVKLTPTYILPIWVAATVYALGAIVTPTVSNGYKYKVTVAGTSHATTEPTWPTGGVGSTVVDGTVTWSLMAITHPATEIKLALTSGGLAGATGGALLNLGTTLLSGSANAVQVNIRITNTNTTVNDNTGYPELALYINNVQEGEV